MTMTVTVADAVRDMRVGMQDRGLMLRRRMLADMTLLVIRRQRMRIRMALIRMRVTTGIQRSRLATMAGMVTTGAAVVGELRRRTTEVR
jgi:hypothetical protein